MNETFEAVVFGRSGGTWKILARQRTGEVGQGLRWVQSEMHRLGTLQSYQRLRARVISSCDPDTAEVVLASLG